MIFDPYNHQHVADLAASMGVRVFVYSLNGKPTWTLSVVGSMTAFSTGSVDDAVDLWVRALNDLLNASVDGRLREAHKRASAVNDQLFGPSKPDGKCKHGVAFDHARSCLVCKQPRLTNADIDAAETHGHRDQAEDDAAMMDVIAESDEPAKAAKREAQNLRDLASKLTEKVGGRSAWKPEVLQHVVLDDGRRAYISFIPTEGDGGDVADLVGTALVKTEDCRQHYWPLDRMRLDFRLVGCIHAPWPWEGLLRPDVKRPERFKMDSGAVFVRPKPEAKTAGPYSPENPEAIKVNDAHPWAQFAKNYGLAVEDIKTEIHVMLRWLKAMNPDMIVGASIGRHIAALHIVLMGMEQAVTEHEKHTVSVQLKDRVPNGDDGFGWIASDMKHLYVAIDGVQTHLGMFNGHDAKEFASALKKLFSQLGYQT